MLRTSCYGWRRRVLPRGVSSLVHTSSVAPPPQETLQAAYCLALGVDDHDSIRIAPEQAQAVASAVAGYSVFLHLPTGAGKSLAFQVPAILAPKGTTTLVVSPLLALIHDQVASLKRKGIAAEHVSVAFTRSKHNRNVPLDQLLANKRLVYTTPEFLMQNGAMRKWVRSLREREGLNRIVIDEAHCVLEWGNTFRPMYLELCRWKARHFNDVPVTLATATVLEEDIPRLAELFHARILDSLVEVCHPPSFPRGDHLSTQTRRAEEMVLVQNISDRPNLHIEVVQKNHSHASALIHDRVGHATAIVYCLTRREADELCLELIRLGCRAGVYHGGIPLKRREYVRKQWMGGQISLICATSAFGMGIDRSDVRCVVHHSLPLSIAAYYQQIGRAGRDGKPAVCLLLYAGEDKTRAHMITTERVDENDGSILSAGASYADVEEVAALCETTQCRRAHIAAHFGHHRQTLSTKEACARNCNCGPLEEPLIHWDTVKAELPKELVSSQGSDGDVDDTEERDPSTMDVEYHYHKVLTESKRHGLPKREALTRRAIREILRAEPSSVEEMALVRNVGQDKAERYFYCFSFR